MDNPLISLIIPVYNVEQYVSRCLESVLAQTYDHFECIIVNDGSTDSSGEICSRYAETDPRITIITKENGGLGSARNAGLDAARGILIAFVDSDDRIAPHYLETLLGNLLVNNADISICGHFVESVNDIRPVRSDGTVKVLSQQEALGMILADRDINSFAWDKLCRRSLFDGIRYPVGRVYEDTATTFRLFYRAKKVVLMHIPLYYYVRRNTSLSLEPNPVRDYHNFLAFFERYVFADACVPASRKVCLAYAMNQAVCTIDNFALAPKQVRQRIPEADIIEKAGILYRAHGPYPEIARKKLRLFYFSPALYYRLYQIFYKIKKVRYGCKLFF
jgi:glycosyltransferase involved in cell wall biosynthesis